MSKNAEKWNSLAAHITSQYAESYSQQDYVTALNEEAAKYYQRLYQALPEDIRNRFKPIAPLVYFAEDPNAVAELIIAGAGYPALIGLPDPERGPSTMMYGLTRAFLEQSPEILIELKALVQKQLPDQQAIVAGLLGDVVAKLVGIALLFDPAKFKDYLLGPIKPQSAALETEIKPTVGLLVPYLGFAALQHFLNYFLSAEELANKRFEQRIAEITMELDNLLAPHLDKPCEPLLNIKVASLKDMRDAFIATVNILLSREMTLSALAGKSLFEFCIACIQVKPKEIEPAIGELAAQHQQFFSILADVLPAARVLPLPLCPSGVAMSGMIDFFDPISLLVGFILAILAS